MRTDPIWVPSEQHSKPSVHKKSSIHDVSLDLGGDPAGVVLPHKPQAQTLNLLRIKLNMGAFGTIFESLRAQKKAQSKD